MALAAADIDRLADELLDRAVARVDGGPLTDDTPFDIGDGYAIQAALVAKQVAAGDRVIGAKLGLTSKAKQKTMGIDEPAYGVVLASTLLPSEEAVDLGRFIHPRVEPEIVFRMGASLAGPGVGIPDVLAATESIGCGFEVIDSRYANFKFTLPDVVADNTSAAGVVLGPTWVAPSSIPDLALVGVLLEADGVQVATAAGAAILGHPAGAVAVLANWLGARGLALEPGWLVMSGGMTDAVPLAAGHSVTATFAYLGSLTVRA